MNRNEVIEKLAAYYPDGKVKSLSTEHRKLYNSTKEIARKKDISVGNLIVEWGFDYDFGGIPFDPKIAIKLHNDFCVPHQRFAEWTRYSKQMISYLITGYLNGTGNSGESIGSWSSNELSEEVAAIAAEMIANKQFSHSRLGIRTILGNNSSGQMYLAVITTDSIAVYFNDEIPVSLIRLIKANKMDQLSEKEMSLVRMGAYVDVMLTPHFLPHPDTQKTFYELAFKKGMSADQFSVYLTGCPCGLAIDKSSDERIVTFLKSNVVNGKVYLSSHPSTQWIRSLAYRRNLKLSELVALYGFSLADKGFSRRNPVFLRQSKKTSCQSNFTTNDEQKLQILKNLGKLKGRNGRKRKVVYAPIRNNELKDQLKRLYDYKCQLCDGENEIPRIIDATGKPFITTHHFKGLAGVSDLDDDSTEILDSAENLIVCCPHHHHFLEHHHGGFHTAFKDESGTVWLQNADGEKIKLAINYHFLIDEFCQSKNISSEKEAI